MNDTPQAAARREAAEKCAKDFLEAHDSQQWVELKGVEYKINIRLAFELGWDARGQHDAAQQQSQEPVADAEVAAMIARLDERIEYINRKYQPNGLGDTGEDIALFGAAAALFRRLSKPQADAVECCDCGISRNTVDAFCHGCGSQTEHKAARKKKCNYTP